MTMKLKTKLLLILLAVALVPALIVGITGLHRASAEMEKEGYAHLVSIREIKKSQITHYFAERQGDLATLSSSVSNLLDFSSKAQLNDSSHQLHNYFKKYIQTYGYYDLFLIDDSGRVFYTVERESDYGSDLNNGPYRTSGLAKLYRQVLERRQYAMIDFSPYQPSNNEPAAFIAQPVEVRGQRMVIALQLSIDRINEIMSQRDGMGQTGESYLVGNDFRMRSDSYLDPLNHSIKASFAGTVQKNGVQTEAVNASLRGETGAKLIIDYNGHPVLSAYTPLQIGDLSWALVSEIDEAEAFAAITDLRNEFLLMGVICIVLVLGLAWQVANSIVRPIGGEPVDMQQLSERIASGDLTMQFNSASTLTGIYRSMQTMTSGLRNMIGDIAQTSDQLASAAQQTSVASTQATHSLSAQSKNIDYVATAVDEMSSTIREIAKNIDEVAGSTRTAKSSSAEANTVAQETLGVVNALSKEVAESCTVITDLEHDSQSIGAVLEVIRNITEQTNLLALNAAIEAARAGEQGRGFAVVADEVRVLAQKTQNSTKDIESMIEQLQQRAQEAVVAMNRGHDSATHTIDKVRQTVDIINRVDQDIDTIDEMAVMIATAGEQQSSATEEINRSLSGIKEAAEENSVVAEQTSQASLQLNELAGQMNQLSQAYKL